MHPQQRRKELLVLLAKHGFVSFHDLAERLQVSEMTVRRDLRVLQDEGLVEQVLGGGQVSGAADEPAFMTKRVMQQREKLALTRLALTLIEPNMTIAFSAGTTTWMLAQQIRGFSGLTFVTNSTNIALDLSANHAGEIILTGGNFRTPSDALVGPLAEATVRRLHTDLLFLGCHGVDVENGVSTPNLSEAAVDRAMMERAGRVALLFDHTKWGVEALAHIANLQEVDILLTDDGGGEREVAALRQQGSKVMVATSEG